METLDSSDDFLMQEGKDDEFKARLLALSEPYSTISQILEEFRNKSEEAGSISRKDISYIHGMIQNTGITMEDFDKDLDDFEKKITSFLSDKTIPRARLYDYCCELFSYNFFQELVKALLTKYGEASDYESFVIFSGANRTVAERNALCDCDKDAEADVRGCEKCDPIEVLLSSEIIRLYRNKALYLKSEDLQKSRSESQLEKILIHFKNRKKISMKPGIELKLYATFFHILGCNEFLWEKSPRTIEEIWENYPVTNTTERLRETIDNLLQNNHGWGKEGNYVDEQGRMMRLENALSASSIITIWGEGGLGKTELVYQTLSGMLKKESTLDFEELIPFTFKGSQGEFNFRGGDDTSSELRPANQIGWNTAEGISPLITILAHRQSEIDPSIDNTTGEGNSNAAVDYLIENDVWLIIDNHEVQDDGVLDEFLELYAKRKRRGGYKENTRIIITTRVPPANSIGTVIDIPVLNVQEMKQLAQNKVVWDRKKHGEKVITSKFSQPDMFQNEIWEQINTKIQNQLKSKRYRKAAGHPYVVFAAVHRALYDEKYAETEFDEIVLGLIKQFDENPNQIGAMHELQMYIFGESFKSLIDEENKVKFLHLTQYSELSTRVFRDKVGFKQWEEIIEELSRREIIILKPNQDSEETYEWRTGYHPKLIQEHLKEEWGEEPEYSQIWKFWHSRMSLINNNKTIRKDTLATINVGSATQTNKDKFKQQLEILNFKWLLDRKEVGEFGWDFDKLIEILIHFSELYLELVINGVENENFPTSDKSEATRAEFLGALELIILNSLDGLVNYLRFISKNDLNLSYKVFTAFCDVLKRSKDRRKEIASLQEEKLIPDISPFLQTFDDSWREIYSNLIQNTPPYTKFTSTQHDVLLQLGSFEEFGPAYLFALLPQFGYAGPIKDQKLLNLLLEYSQQFIEEKQGIERDVAIPQDKLQAFSKFIYDTDDVISSIGTGKTLGKEFFLEFDSLIQDGEGETTLFKRRDVKLEIQIKGNTLIGTDEDENTWKIHNCTSNTEKNKSYEIRCIPFFIDGEETIHAIFVILKDVLETLTKTPTIPVEKTPEIVDYIPIEAVTAKQMWSILRSIQFQSIPAATLFGDKLKEELKKQKIEHTGKVWRTWRNKEYPKERLEEEVPEGYDAIEFIIKDLSAGEWSVLELNAGKNKTIRKLPKEVVCQTCNQSVEVTEEIYDEDTGEVYEVDWYCLSCDHTIDENGFCMEADECKACEGYPICRSCYERKYMKQDRLNGEYWCDFCKMYVYDEEEERRMYERAAKRDMERIEMIDRTQDDFDSWVDREIQKRGKGRW
jgi:hypothetical protein